MKYEILIPVATALVLILLLLFVVCVCSFLGKRSRSDRAMWLSRILPMIISCNTYPKMYDVFAQLEADLDKFGIILQDDFRGYFNNEQ